LHHIIFESSHLSPHVVRKWLDFIIQLLILFHSFIYFLKSKSSKLYFKHFFGKSKTLHLILWIFQDNLLSPMKIIDWFLSHFFLLHTSLRKNLSFFLLFLTFKKLVLWLLLGGICTAGLEFESGRASLVRAWNGQSFTCSFGPTKCSFRKVGFSQIKKNKKKVFTAAWVAALKNYFFH